MFDALPGIPALRKAICDFHQRYDDITFRPEDVLVGPGSKELIFLAMNVFKGGKSSLIILNSEHTRDTFIIPKVLSANISCHGGVKFATVSISDKDFG